MKANPMNRESAAAWWIALLAVVALHLSGAIGVGQEVDPAGPADPDPAAGPTTQLAAEPPKIELPPEIRLNTTKPLQGPGLLAERGNVVEKITRAWRLGEEGRWSVAVSLLQSIIDAGDQGSMYLIDERTYIDSREFVQRVIETKLPPEGRRTYRDTYGPLAAKLLARAAETLNAEQALDVAERFLNTAAGAEAAEAAGDFLANQGRFREAAGAYLRLVRVRPGGGDPPATVYAKLAYCYGRLGQGSRITGLERLTKPGTRASKVPLGGSVETLTAALKELAAESGAVPLGRIGETSMDWPTLGGGSGRMHVMQDAPISLEKRWSKKIVDEDEPKVVQPRYYPGRTTAKPLRVDVLPSVVGDMIVVFREGYVRCYDIYTGQVRWKDTAVRQRAVSGARYNMYLRYGYQPEDAVVTIANGLVYYCGRMPAVQQHIRPGQTGPKQQLSYLMARELATNGKLVWDAIKANQKVTIDDVPASEILMDMVFVGVPVATADGLYVVATADGEVLYLLKFDASKDRRRGGRLLWKQYLSSGTAPSTMRFGFSGESVTVPPSILPSVAESQVIVVGNNGLVLSLDAETGQFNWVTRYKSDIAPPQTSGGRIIRRPAVKPPKPLNGPIIAAGRVIFLPYDSDQVHCLDATDGQLLWESMPLTNAQYLLGVRDGVAVVAGDKLDFIDLATGKKLRSVALPEILGRPALTDQGVWYATKGSLVRVNLTTAQIDRRIGQLPGADADELGSLVFVHNKLLATSGNKITAYFSFEDSYQELTKRLAAAPRKAPLLLSRGKVCSGGQEFEKAIVDYNACLAIADPVGDKDTIYEAKRMLFETYLDYGANTKGSKSIENLDKAAAYTQDVDHHVRLHLQYAGSFERMGKFPEAVDHYRVLFLKWPRHNHRFTEGKQGTDVAIGIHAEQRIGELIRKHGQTVYTRYEREAEQRYEKAMAAKSAETLRKIVDAYPNSKWKPLSWLNAGRFDFAAGRLNDARMSFRRAETTALSLQQKAEALAGQFAVAEARGEKPTYLRRARRILDELAALLATEPGVRVPVAAERKPALAWAKALLASDRFKSIPAGAVQGEDPSRLAVLAADLLKSPPAWASSSGPESLIQPVYFGAASVESVVLTRDIKGTVGAFDVRTGKRLWRATMPGTRTVYPPQNYKAAVYDDLLVICDSDMVSAYQLGKSGKLAWRHAVPRPTGNYYQAIREKVGNVSSNTAAQYAFTPEAVVILTMTGEVKVVDVRSGKLRFNTQSAEYTWGTPAGNEDAIAYLTAGSMKLVVLDAVTGQHLFSVASKEQGVVRRMRTVYVDEDNVFIEMDGRFRCHDIHKGTLRWEHALPDAINDNCPLVWVLAETEDRLIVGTQDARLKVLDKRTGKLVWEKKYSMVNAYTGNYPLIAVVSETDVYAMIARTNAYATLRQVGMQVQLPMIYSYNLDTGKLNWKVAMGGKQNASVMVGEPTLTCKHLITSMRSRIYQNRKQTITDEVRMFDAVTGKLAHAKTETGAFDPQNAALRHINIPPGTQARGDTLVLDGAKGPTAYRK